MCIPAAKTGSTAPREVRCCELLTSRLAALNSPDWRCKMTVQLEALLSRMLASGLAKQDSEDLESTLLCRNGDGSPAPQPVGLGKPPRPLDSVYRPGNRKAQPAAIEVVGANREIFAGPQKPGSRTAEGRVQWIRAQNEVERCASSYKPKFRQPACSHQKETAFRTAERSPMCTGPSIYCSPPQRATKAPSLISIRGLQFRSSTILRRFSLCFSSNALGPSL